MANGEPGWELYRSFLAVLQEGSLTAAARTLRLTQPTVGRHIDQLEQALRVPLFTRSQQGLLATDAALQLEPHARTMAASARALLRAASGEADEVRGTVRLTASEIIGAEVLPPILADFRARFPGIVIELVLSNRNEDLLRREVDLAVRMAQPTQTALVAKRLGAVGLGLHAHRRYVDAHGKPQSFEELAAHPLIGFDRETASVRSLRGTGLTITREMFALRSDSDLAQLAALRAGFGIGACQFGIARRDPDLLHILPEGFAVSLDVWVVMHEDSRASRRVRLLFDHLVRQLATYVASSQPQRKPKRPGS
ncbi:MAG: LysR family transcriptional regulator [Xanthobacteraceae bacterium]